MFSLCQFGIRAFQKKVDHRGIRTPNLLIRSQTPYPLGHAACVQEDVNLCCIWFFSALHNILSSASSLWCLLPFHSRLLLSACFRCLCQLLDSRFAKKVDHRGIQVPLKTGRIAQRIKRLTSKQKIGGSNPSVVDFFEKRESQIDTTKTCRK